MRFYLLPLLFAVVGACAEAPEPAEVTEPDPAPDTLERLAGFVDFNRPNKDGLYPIDLAIGNAKNLVVQFLLEKGAAYRCFCTRERLDALRASQQAQKQTVQQALPPRHLQ